MRLSCCLQVCHGQSGFWCMSSFAFAWKECVCRDGTAWQRGQRQRQVKKAHTTAQESQDLQDRHRPKNNGL